LRDANNQQSATAKTGLKAGVWCGTTANPILYRGCNGSTSVVAGVSMLKKHRLSPDERD
jgi:hypothetical protein